jgi:hypothetical protein
VKREARPFDFWFSCEDKIQRRYLVIAAGHPDKPGTDGADAVEIANSAGCAICATGRQKG